MMNFIKRKEKDAKRARECTVLIREEDPLGCPEINKYLPHPAK